MKHVDDIDKLFKDKLENNSIPDIPQAYLDDINKRLDNLSPQNKKRDFSPFLGTIAILSIVAAALYFSMFNNTKSAKNEYSQTDSSENKLGFNNNTSPSQKSYEDNLSSDYVKNINRENKSNITVEVKGFDSKPIFNDKLANSVADQKREMEFNKISKLPSSELNVSSKTNHEYILDSKTDKNGVIIPTRSLDKKEITVDQTTDATGSGKTKATKQQSTISITNESKINSNKGEPKSATLTPTNTSRDIQNENSDQIHSKIQTLEIAANSTPPFANKKEVKLKNIVKSAQSSDEEKASNLIKSTDLDSKENSQETVTKKVLLALDSTSTKNSKLLIASNKIESTFNETKGILPVKTETEKKDSINIENRNIVLKSLVTDSLNKVEPDTVSIAVNDSSKQNPPIPLKLTDSINTSNSKRLKTIQFLVGYAKIYSVFKSRNSNYDSKRNNEENDLWTVDASILFNYNRNRLVYTAGLNYSQWGENINYTATTDSVNYFVRHDTTYATQQVDSATFIINSHTQTVYSNMAVANNELTAHNGKNS